MSCPLADLGGASFFDASRWRFRLARYAPPGGSRLPDPAVPHPTPSPMTPMEQGRPIWVDNDRFDISYHGAPDRACPTPGTWEQGLRTLTGRIEAHTL